MKTAKTEWNIKELETFFNENKLPAPPIKLNVVCHITNVRAFIDSHLDILKTNFERPTFEPYLFRLQQLKQWIEDNKQL
jgi:hypothetical protein